MSGRIISHPRIEQELPCQRLELDTTYGVDDDGSEDRGCDCRPVLGIFLAADELWMVTPEEDSEDRQNNDSKYRNSKASKASAALHDPSGPAERRHHPPRPCLHGADNGLHLGQQNTENVGFFSKQGDLSGKSSLGLSRASSCRWEAYRTIGGLVVGVPFRCAQPKAPTGIRDPPSNFCLTFPARILWVVGPLPKLPFPSFALQTFL
jgi:hypothetical protein